MNHKKCLAMAAIGCSGLFAISHIAHATHHSDAIKTDNNTKFKIAQIPDTQGFFFANEIHCKHTNPSQIEDMYAWIQNDHKDAVPYKAVVQVGDIVDGNGGDGDKMWGPATTTYGKTLDNNAAKIPYLWTTGNHDYTGASAGFGNLDQPNHWQHAKTFLGKMHQHPNNPGVQLINNNPLLAYTEFTVGTTHPVTIDVINIPYCLSNELENTEDALKHFLAAHPKNLLIFNAHTYGAWPHCPPPRIDAGSRTLIKLWGHDPNNLYKSQPKNRSDRAFDPIPATLEGHTYVYRFDYQEGGPPYTCEGANNFPQHPLLRSYDFSYNDAEQTLSWQAYDIEAWNINNTVYQNSKWTDEARAVIGGGPQVFKNGDPVTVKISDYLK